MLIEGLRRTSLPLTPVATNGPGAVAESRPSLEPVRAAQAPYLSPALQYDSDAAIAVLVFRDAANGDIENQYPSKQVVREYQLRGRDVVQGTSAGSTGERSESGEPNALLGLARGSFSTVASAGGFGDRSTAGGATPTVAASPTVGVVGGSAGTGSTGVNLLA